MRIEKARAISLEMPTARYGALRRGDRKTLKPRTLADKAVIVAREILPRLRHKALGKLTENECGDAVYNEAKASKGRANKMAAELSCFLR